MAKSFTIAIASGKGGTGKTTISTNLACALSQAGKNVQYLDCDVEEPNGHIFLKPEIEKTSSVTIGVPEVDETLCDGCGKCGELCQYNAIVSLKSTPLVFEQLCHSCGGCMLVCPNKAINEKAKEIGFVDIGSADKVQFGRGRLKIGDIHTPSLIKKVKSNSIKEGIIIIDAPPGTSCPVIEAIKESDFVLLVTEPTPFGLNDLKLAVGMVRELGIPFAVVINRSDKNEKMVNDYCNDENIQVVLEIPEQRKIAEAYSEGTMIIDTLPEFKKDFVELYERISNNQW